MTMIQIDEDTFIKNDRLGYVLYIRRSGKFNGDVVDDEEEVIEDTLEEEGQKPTPLEKESAFIKKYPGKVSHAISYYLNNQQIDSPELSAYVERLEAIEKRVMAIDFSPLANKED